MRIGSRSGFAVAGLWLATVLTGIWLASSSAVAQQTPQNPMDNPSVVQPKNDDLPLRGANSFSEGQARSLIESQGYSGVSALMNDRHGIWHGTASKGAARVVVSVDYKGNVTARQE